MNYIAQQYKGKVNLLAIGQNSGEDINEFLDSNDWEFTHISDPNGTLIKSKFLNVWGFPVTFIADQNAKIIRVFSGGSTDSTAVKHIIDKVEPILKKLIDK